eukprot:XP_011678092.1 PREDICTED: uncharacterized protein LOC100888916 [Strongylocentrotus purpuratus]
MNSRPKNSKFHRQTQRILDKRPSEVVPVGAWVELCPQHDNDAFAAVVAAQYEGERLQTLQAEKEAKLARFRQEVRSRVRELQRIKKQKQLQESFQAVNLQGRVVHRTTPSANILSHRKDNCIYQNSEPHAIGRTAPQPTPEAWGREGQVDGGLVIGQQVREQAGVSRRLVQKAKRDLAAKQLVVKPKMDKHSVPGGIWGSAYSRDKPAEMVDKIPANSASGVNDLQTFFIHNDRRISQDTIEEALYDESGDCYPNHQNREPEESGYPRSKHVTFAPRLQRSPQLAARVKAHRHGHGDHSEPSDLQHVYVPPYEPDPEEYFTVQEELPLYSEGNGDTDVKAHVIMGDRFKGHVPEVNPGVVAEEQRRQHGMQFSMYRRLYSDIEREQVREKMRKKTHHKKIQELKKAKEQERLEVEHQSQLVSQPVDILRESDKDMRRREMEEAEEIHRIQTRLRQKNKETKRYGQLRLETILRCIEPLDWPTVALSESLHNESQTHSTLPSGDHSNPARSRV